MEATAKDIHTEVPALRAEPKKSLRDRFKAMPRGSAVPVDLRRFPDAPQDAYVKAPSGADIAVWEQSGIEYGRKGKIKVVTSRTRKAELIAMCLCDADGTLAFTQSQADVKEIASWPSAIVNALYRAASDVSGQTSDDDEDEDEEDAEGN